MLSRIARVTLALALSAVGITAGAEVRLPAVFTTNMVLQRGMKAPVWGWADPGEKVTVSFNATKASATADSQGAWKVAIGPFKAGGPFQLTAAGKSNTVTVDNVLVGDVWICSGQSNMEMGILNVNNAQQEVAQADYPKIRLLTVPKATPDQPQTDIKASWLVCSPQNVAQGVWGGFSAAGYFFGRDLYKKYNVPIGLIHTSWGGTPAEAWTRREVLAADADLSSMLSRIPKQPNDAANPWNSWTPSSLYNGMIAPLIPFGIKGAIWYQGESNANRAYQYRKLFATMITNWRKDWGQGDFPFFFVQLANYTDRNTDPVQSDWAELREAQTMTLSLPKTGMAVIIDIGDAKDIHPKDKQGVGKRLALAAMNVAYNDKTVEGFSPLYKSMTKANNKLVLQFTHLGGGLVTKDGGAPVGFAIAGPDKVFKWANATIVGNTIEVSNASIADPVAVRYGWSNNPDVNVFSKAGLPLSPFRTDDWPGVTINNK